MVVLDWNTYIGRLSESERQVLREAVHDACANASAGNEVVLTSTLLVQAAAAAGWRLSPERAHGILRALDEFGFLRRDGGGYSPTEYGRAAAANADLFEVFVSSAEEELLRDELDAVRERLRCFAERTTPMVASARDGARATVMGNIIGAKGRFPEHASLFEDLRLEHNRTAPPGAQLRVMRAA